jgi:hypothetical protein
MKISRLLLSFLLCILLQIYGCNNPEVVQDSPQPKVPEDKVVRTMGKIKDTDARIGGITDKLKNKEGTKEEEKKSSKEEDESPDKNN